MSAVEEGLYKEIHLHKEIRLLLDEVTDEEALELGREAARAIIGPLLLRRLLGEDRFDTTAAARMLQITRQALHKRVQARSLLAVPGRGTTWYPAWQFDIENRCVRPEVRAVLAAWAEVLEDRYDPETVLAWANSPQPELDGETPAEWIGNGGEDENVTVAARRAARGLAS